MFRRGGLKAAAFMLAALMASPAVGADRDAGLQATIAKQKVILEAFEKAWAAAPSFDETHSLVGTWVSAVGIPEATCAALAYLFGKDAIHKRLEKFETPHLTARMTNNQRARQEVSGVVLTNQIYATEEVLKLSLSDRIQRWNLSCIGQHDIGEKHALASPKPRANFVATGHQKYQLRVLGQIDSGFYERFRAALDRNPQVTMVALGSGGGSVIDALNAGALIRKRGLATTLYADCLSACPLVFLGGVERRISQPYPRLGFHQATGDGKTLQAGHKLYSLIERYARSMGADSTYLLRVMHRAPPRGMHYPDLSELCAPKARVVTWVQRSAC